MVTGSWRSWWSQQCKPRLCVKDFCSRFKGFKKRALIYIANPKFGIIFFGDISDIPQDHPIFGLFDPPNGWFTDAYANALGKCLFINDISWTCPFASPWRCIHPNTRRLFPIRIVLFEHENFWGPQNLGNVEWQQSFRERHIWKYTRRLSLSFHSPPNLDCCPSRPATAMMIVPKNIVVTAVSLPPTVVGTSTGGGGDEPRSPHYRNSRLIG